MSVQKMDYNRVICDAPGCMMVINLAAINTEHMRDVLTANKWFMATDGEVVHDEISGNDFIGYKTLCPTHKESR